MVRPPTSGTALRKAWRAIVPPSLRKYGQGAAIVLAQRRVSAALASGEVEIVDRPLRAHQRRGGAYLALRPGA